MSNPDPEAPSRDPARSDAEHARRRELDQSVASGIAWTGGVRSLTQGVQWVAALLVVRLLTPEDYGLVAMATAYLGLVQMFSTFGLGAAIVQRQDLTKEQIARLGGFSLLAGSVLALVSVIASGLVASFFDEPRVQPIVLLLSVTFVLSGAGVIPRSLLKRDLNFKRLALIQAARNLTYSGSALSLAALGFSYWSLVIASLLGTCVGVFAALVSRPHAITWPKEIESIRSELWFGGHVVVTQLALYLRRFADVLVVGRTLGTEALGIYNVGWTNANIPVERVTPIVTSVSAAVFAASQDSPTELRRYVKMFTEGIALLAFPACFGLAVVADDFVLLVFGERWMATVVPLRILAIVGAMRSITPVLSQVLIATDQAKKNMQFAVAAAVTIPCLLLIGSRWGVSGVAAGWLIGHPTLVGAVLLRHTLRTTELSLRAYLASLSSATMATGLLLISVLVARTAMPEPWPLALRFGVQVGVGAVVYGLCIFAVYRRKLKSFMSFFREARRTMPDAALDDRSESS